MEYISDRIIIRAAALWCRALRSPKFDNGDTSTNGFYAHVLSSVKIARDRRKIDDMDVRINKFKFFLVKELIRERNSGLNFTNWLDTDYGPCEKLADAAEKADIPMSQFSCKSFVMMHPDKVTCSFGYRAKKIYHYSLENNSWLVTDISGGDDMQKIFKHVKDGNQMGFVIEDDE